LERIQGAPSYILLLYLMKYLSKFDISEKTLNRVVNFLVSFFVRRNLTDIPPTRDLNRIFIKLIGSIKGCKGEKVYSVIREGLRKLSASDELFYSKLTGNIYEENARVTRFILCEIEESHMTKETWRNLWKMEGNKYVWTIEHIFPQGESIPQSWIDMIADGDREKAMEYQREFVHRLGNLTLTGYNPNLGNKSFVEKRDRKDKQGRPVGYRNGLWLNKDIAPLEVWTIKMIEERTRKLADIAMKMYEL